jgi:hypothetical protein
VFNVIQGNDYSHVSGNQKSTTLLINDVNSEVQKTPSSIWHKINNLRCQKNYVSALINEQSLL